MHQWGYHYRLTMEDAKEIRRLYESTRSLKTNNPERWTYERLMAKYEVGRDTIAKILANVSYVE